MRREVLVGALAGCNQVFALKTTSELPAVDARYFDAPTDAAPTCPPDGSPPTFSPTLHQIPQDCFGYTLSATTGLAIASCRGPETRGAISQGSIDHELTASTMSWPDSGFTPQLQPPPVISADGDQMVALGADSVGNWAYASYQLQPDGSWLAASAMQLPFPAGNGDAVSAPTHRPNRRMLYLRSSFDGSLHELAEDQTGAWQDVGVISIASLGLLYLQSIELSADGLRLIAIGETTTLPGDNALYSSRSDLSAAFPPPAVLASVPPGAGHPFLTDDCARVYFDGLSNLFYVQQ